MKHFVKSYLIHNRYQNQPFYFMNPELLFQNYKILNSMAILLCLAVRETLKILLYSFQMVTDSGYSSDWGKKGKTAQVSDRKRDTISWALQSGVHYLLGRGTEKRHSAILSQLEAVVVLITYLAMLPAHLSFIYKENKEKAENWEGKANKENMNSENIMVGMLLLQSFDA